MIKIEILEKHKMGTLEDYKSHFGDNKETELIFYQTFLAQTDYIANKLIECQVTKAHCDDYTEELKARQFARNRINELQKGGNL